MCHMHGNNNEHSRKMAVLCGAIALLLVIVIMIWPMPCLSLSLLHRDYCFHYSMPFRKGTDRLEHRMKMSATPCSLREIGDTLWHMQRNFEFSHFSHWDFPFLCSTYNIYWLECSHLGRKTEFFHSLQQYTRTWVLYTSDSSLEWN